MTRTRPAWRSSIEARCAREAAACGAVRAAVIPARRAGRSRSAPAPPGAGPVYPARVTRLAALAAVALACSPSPGAQRPAPADPAPSPTPSVASAAEAVPTPTPTPRTDSQPSGPLELPLTAAAAFASGREQPLERGAITVVEVSSHFAVEVAVALQDARLSLLDADGAMVAAAGGAEIGGKRTRFTLAPEEPLVTGSEYALRLDGALRRTAHDPEGRPYAPATWPLLTAGEKPKPEPRRGDARRRR
jgi:hypothetical protein